MFDNKASASLILCALVVSGCARLTDVQPTFVVDGQLQIHTQLHTWKDALEQNIVMQRFDYSCGPAAMATLMSYYFNDEVSEREILIDIVSNLSAEEFENRKLEGLSMLDLKNFAELHGYQAFGVRLDPSALSKLRGPILVYLETADFKHFAVLRGVREDRVFLSDPSRGNVRMSLARFFQEWPGIALVLGKEGYGIPVDHALAIDFDSTLRPEREEARRGLYLRY